MNLYRLVILVFLFFSTSLLLEAQKEEKISFWQSEYPKKMLYGKYTELKISQLSNSNTTFLLKYPIVFFQANREWKDVEWFEPRDTIVRDTLLVYKRKYTIDSLVALKSQFTGAYILSHAFSTFNREKEYVILRFFDGYQMGSDVQGIYIIFELNKTDARFCASYIENLNHRSSKVRIVKKKNGVYLKSKNFDRCK